MAIYRFKVELEDHEGILREIEIKSTQTFEDLHSCILKAFAFDAKHPAAFFLSDDLWHLDEELVYKDLPFRPFNNPTPMNRAKIADYIDDPHQRFIFLYDYEEGWSFLVELIKIDPNNALATGFPKVVKTIGDAPKQYNIKTYSKSQKDDQKIPSLDDDDDDLAEVADVASLFGAIEVGDDEKEKGGFDLIDDEFESDKDENMDEDVDDFDDEDEDDAPSGKRGSEYDDD